MMEQLKKILDLLIVVLYFMVGVLLMFSNLFMGVTPMFRTIFGVILVLYGIFRANQFYSKYFLNKDNENS